MVECRPIVCVLGVLFLSLLGTTTAAQPGPDSTHSPSVTQSELRPTLQEWSADRRRLVLDRKHSYGSRHFDRGVFRHVTPEMDREYELDMLMYRFTPTEADYPSRADNSLLLRVGSIERDIWALSTRLQSTVPLDSSKTLTIDGTFQQDAEAHRAFLEIGYAWQVAPHHTVGVRHTFSEYKADLDLTAFYRYSVPRIGSARVSITAQNLYNDFIYEQLGISADALEVLRTYDRAPYLLSLSVSTPKQYPLRGEAIAALQPLSRAVFESQTTPDYRFRDDERLHYMGALIEYRRSPFTTGMFYKRDASWLRRVGEGPEVSSDYTSSQAFQRFGAFVTGRWGRLRGRIRAFTGNYRDQQHGDDYSESIIEQSVDYDEEQRGLQARLLHDPERGAIAGLEYAALQREYHGDELALIRPWTRQWWTLGPSNYRLVGLLGYRFSRGKIIVGIGYDLDGDPLQGRLDSPRRFDNGFGRLVLTW